ncbi:GntR family transcriptional repressor for pyruvate dehydrogenase complex [Rhodobium orientis]|uniref:Pyruvate dehydrogenase complex repressor n=1 Tax=Rhodobium orientis TaxID=34017 RepID=A0A327JSY1_9HYPH|nr:FadR/GntR family transcriptional regulator [Rhodobium orientis]MBB4304145.1 GntR family transcriptional repressor for pyruvate dehydrogenase complex [Rhodobium orientis]MBK5950616.1 GntR family transcriptional regulator [Rhodobium orientis]RAI28002.1 GntR family transcriptional regulator [Rhodobium orientis]
MIFQRIRHNVTADAVVDQVEGLILQGVLRSGDQLPPERELAKLVDVSRPILRDAIKRLEERGLIVTRHGEGTFVADLIGTVFSEPIIELFQRRPPAVRDYLEFRRDIEAVAAGLAAERATAADREILTRLFRGMEAAHGRGDFDEEAAIDVELHAAIGESSHNIMLLHVLRACYRLLADGIFYSRNKLYAYADAPESLLGQHRAIYEAIMGGDRARAEAAARAHMDFVITTIDEIDRAGMWQTVASMRLQQLDQRPGGGTAGRGTRRRAARATKGPDGT